MANTLCINEESSTEWRSYNRQVKRIFFGISRPESVLIKQDSEGLCAESGRLPRLVRRQLCLELLPLIILEMF